MGLDMVEIVMSIEDRFGMKFERDESLHIRTVGHLHDYIMRRRFGRAATGHPVQSAFYRLRRALVSVQGVDRSRIRPSTPIAELIPRRSRRRAWKLLGRELALDLPPLTQPDGVIAGYFVWACAVVAAATGLLSLVTNSGKPIGWGVLSIVATSLIGYGVSVRLATLPWTGFQTVGGLAKAIVSYNYEEFSAPGPSTDQCDEVWEALCEIVSNTLRVQREKITRDSRLIEDLGAD